MSAFDSLRQDDHRIAPDPRFARRLRAQLEAALAPEAMTQIDLPERNPAMTATEPTTEIAARTATITPYVAVSDAARAIAWYADVLGARETVRYTDDSDGRIGHAELEIGGTMLMLSDEYPDFDAVAPTTLGGSPVALHVDVADVDAVWQRAIASGADGKRPPEDHPYGERMCTFVDPFGHRWMVATQIAEPTVDEIDEASTGFTVTAPLGEPASAPVEIGYLTIAFDDTLRASRFYGELFGWQAEPGNMGETYVHVANTRLPLGLTPDGNAGPTELYFRVDDAEAYARRATGLGGQVMNRETYESGASIECLDDQGKRFLLWQPAPGY